MTHRLSEELVEAGLITRVQLTKVRESDRGAQLLFRLIEAGVPEQALAGFFVERGYGPLIHLETMRVAERRALLSIPPALAREIKAVPIAVAEDGVVVALADPTDDHALSRLRSSVNEPILPRAALYSELATAVAEHYPDRRPSSRPPVIHLTRRRLPSGAMPLVRAKPKQSEDDTATLNRRRRSFSDVWDAEWKSRRASEAPVESRAADTETKDDALTAEERGLLVAIRNATSRDAAVEQACIAAAASDSNAVFLAVRKGVFRGWSGAGANVCMDAVRNLWIPVNNKSVLSGALEQQNPFRAQFGAAAADHLLRAALGTTRSSFGACPVFVKDRVVGLICRDRDSRLAFLQAISHEVSDALLRLLSQQKRVSQHSEF
ncbi:MAG: hypothetical protein R3A47_08240 [Polyangiales bacterium]